MIPPVFCGLSVECVQSEGPPIGPMCVCVCVCGIMMSPSGKHWDPFLSVRWDIPIPSNASLPLQTSALPKSLLRLCSLANWTVV